MERSGYGGAPRTQCPTFGRGGDLANLGSNFEAETESPKPHDYTQISTQLPGKLNGAGFEATRGRIRERVRVRIWT